MDQRGSMIGGGYDQHNQNQVFYDPTIIQSEHIQQQQQQQQRNYVIQNYDVDSAQYLLQSPQQISYSAGVGQYDQNASGDHQMLYDPGTISTSSVGYQQQQYVGSVRPKPAVSEHQRNVHYYNPHDQLGASPMQQQPFRVQPMTPEQIQLSQQRLLGLIPAQTLPVQREQPQVMAQTHQQEMTNTASVASEGGGVAMAAAVSGHGSPGASSHNSSGTDISDDVDDTTPSPAMHNRSPPNTVGGKRQGRKKKNMKDPNEPRKPASAYALFFRDMQGTVKEQNPNASFGELSKLVATSWDQLDESGRTVYKRRTEVARKEYLRQLAAYRANALYKGNEQTSSSSFAPPAPRLAAVPPRLQLPIVSTQGQMISITSAAEANAGNVEAKQLQLLVSSTVPMTSHMQTVQTTAVIQDPSYCAMTKPEGVCIRPDCQQRAVECPQWDGEYCTDECVLMNCRDIFNAWTQTKQNTQARVDASLGAIVPS